MAKVSVCMISFNHGKFISQAIESILSQETDFPIEIVIGDDCSSDDTPHICAEYARRDSRIKVLPRERNLGVMPNFADVLSACKGQYIAVCEGDDYWTDIRKLAKQVAFLDSHEEYAGVAHQADVIIDGRFERKFKLGVPETLTTADLTTGRQFHTASVLFRCQVVSLFCGAPRVISCDRLLNFCISFIGKIYYSEESMCTYRLHRGGISSNVTVAQLKLDLSSVEYLKAIQPSFPAYQYRSYVYATIGLCKLATPWQRLYFIILSFLLSFAVFPRNLRLYGSYISRAIVRHVASARPKISN